MKRIFFNINGKDIIQIFYPRMKVSNQTYQRLRLYLALLIVTYSSLRCIPCIPCPDSDQCLNFDPIIETYEYNVGLYIWKTCRQLVLNGLYFAENWSVFGL